MPSERLSTGIPSVDALLAGGLDPDGLTELYGEGGSGKTLLCLQLAARVALADRWVIYIDTEGVSVDRLEAIAHGQMDHLLQRLLITTPKDLASQEAAVARAGALVREGRRPVGLVVVDSATFYYRLSLGEDEDVGRQSLGLQLADLLNASLTTSVPTVFTNQVWRNPKDGELEPLGGTFVGHAAKTILRLDRLPGGRRRVTLRKHRSLPEGSAEFQITSDGLA